MIVFLLLIPVVLGLGYLYGRIDAAFRFVGKILAPLIFICCFSGGLVVAGCNPESPLLVILAILYSFVLFIFSALANELGYEHWRKALRAKEK